MLECVFSTHKDFLLRIKKTTLIVKPWWMDEWMDRKTSLMWYTIYAVFLRGVKKAYFFMNISFIYYVQSKVSFLKILVGITSLLILVSVNKPSCNHLSWSMFAPGLNERLSLGHTCDCHFTATFKTIQRRSIPIAIDDLQSLKGTRSLWV